MNAYYKTHRWHRYRFETLRRDNHLCRICDNREAVQAHHACGYERFKHEEFWELLSVCLSCHEALHNKRGPRHNFKATVKANKEVGVNMNNQYG